MNNERNFVFGINYQNLFSHLVSLDCLRFSWQLELILVSKLVRAAGNELSLLKRPSTSAQRYGSDSRLKLVWPGRENDFLITNSRFRMAQRNAPTQQYSLVWTLEPRTALWTRRDLGQSTSHSARSATKKSKKKKITDRNAAVNWLSKLANVDIRNLSTRCIWNEERQIKP